MQFYIRTGITSKITEFNAPNYFVDEMVSGAFKSFRHEHIFKHIGKKKILMIDTFFFESPLGVLGKIVNTLFLKLEFDLRIIDKSQ